MTPMVLVLLFFRESATALGLYLSFAARLLTASLVSLLISGWSFKALDTVDADILSAFAMSFIVTGLLMKKGVSRVFCLMQFNHLMEYFGVLPDESLTIFEKKARLK